MDGNGFKEENLREGRGGGCRKKKSTREMKATLRGEKFYRTKKGLHRKKWDLGPTYSEKHDNLQARVRGSGHKREGERLGREPILRLVLLQRGGPPEGFSHKRGGG